MHILLVSYEFPPVTAIGGIGSYMYHLAVVLTAAGHQVTVFSADPNASELSVTTQPHGIHYLVPSTGEEAFRWAVLPLFKDFIKTNKVDLIESPEVGACALKIKEEFPQIPLVVKMHTPGVLITKVNNTYVPWLNKIRFVAGALVKGKIDLGYWAKHDKNRNTDAEYRLCMMADILLSPSVALKKWATSFWGIPASKIRVVPNPFSLQSDLFSLPISNRPPVISFVGKLSILKGMKAFTAAIPMILDKNINCKIYLVGRDVVEDGQSMKEFMQEKLTSYTSRIVFTGSLKKEALKEVYANSQVCVFPSLWENYPTVILEAMAAGAAIAASNTGGIPEIITNRVTGLLFNEKKPETIANAVNWLLANDTERIEMIESARKYLISTMSDMEKGRDFLKTYKGC